MIVVQRLLCTTQISVVGGVCLVLRNLCLFVGTLPLRMVSHGSQQTPRHSHIRLRRQVIPEAFLNDVRGDAFIHFAMGLPLPGRMNCCLQVRHCNLQQEMWFEACGAIVGEVC